jgi:hypothetical protein
VHAQFATAASPAAAANPAAAAGASLRALSGAVLPGAAAALGGGGGSDGGAALVGRALMADLAWFTRAAAAVGGAVGDPAAAHDAVIGHALEHMRHLIRWVFAKQFGGPRAYAPQAPAPSPAGAAAVGALNALAAAQLPAAGVALSDQRWLQARNIAAHALLGAALDASAPAAANATPSAATTAVLSAMGAAHVADFWGARADAAAGAGGAAAAGVRVLALDDRAATRGWRDAALGLSTTLSALRAQVAAAAAAAQGGTSAATAAAAKTGGGAAAVRDGLMRMLGGVAVAANGALPDSTPADAVAAGQRAAALADAVAGCNNGAAPACERLRLETGALVQGAFGPSPMDGPLAAAAAAGLALHWRCAVRPPGACAALPGCTRGILATAPPPPSGAGAYASVVTLAQRPDAPTCEADDGRLTLRRGPAAAGLRAALAADTAPGCDAFLAAPACQAVPGGAAGCAAASPGTCRWLPRGLRSTVLGAAAAPAAAAADGVCAADWQGLLSRLSSPELRANLAAAAVTCGAKAGQGACNALMVEVSPSRDGADSALSPKNVVLIASAGSVVALTAAGLVYVFARRAAAARADAEDSSGDGSSGLATLGMRRRRPAGAGRIGKGGKAAKKAALKNKVKRSEPGEYKPDLMRDSFTDYLQRPAFRTGVAIAAANMAAGGPELPLPPPPVFDKGEGGSGSGRGGAGLLLEPTMTFISGTHELSWPQARALACAHSGGAAAAQEEEEEEGKPQQQPGPPLIDLGSGEVAEEALASARHSWQQQQQQTPMAPPAAVTAGREGQQMHESVDSRPPPGWHQPPPSAFSDNPFQPPVGGARGRGPLARVRFGASHDDDGASSHGNGSPTSSCCHDSVCTFSAAVVPPPPASVAGSVADSMAGNASVAGGPRGGGDVAAASRYRSGLETAAEGDHEDSVW